MSTALKTFDVQFTATFDGMVDAASAEEAARMVSRQFSKDAPANLDWTTSNWQVTDNRDIVTTIVGDLDKPQQDTQGSLSAAPPDK